MILIKKCEGENFGFLLDTDTSEGVFFRSADEFLKAIINVGIPMCEVFEYIPEEEVYKFFNWVGWDYSREIFTTSIV